jgi:hypothetical protein
VRTETFVQLPFHHSKACHSGRSEESRLLLNECLINFIGDKVRSRRRPDSSRLLFEEHFG